MIGATANLNFGRKPETHNADLKYIADQGATIILGQELDPAARLPKWDVVGADHDERVLVDWRLKIERSGERLSALSRFGERIGWRVFAWADVDVPGVDTIRFVSVHQPPRRMTRVLFNAYARRLRRLLRRADRRGIPWVAGGDWNAYIRDDPCDLHRLIKARWYGERIDGFAVSPSLQAHIGTWSDESRLRPDGHQIQFLEITPKKEKS